MATIELPKQGFMPLPKSHSQLQFLTRWWRGGGRDDSKHVCALLVPYLNQCSLFFAVLRFHVLVVWEWAADKQVDVPVVPKSWADDADAT